MEKNTMIRGSMEKLGNIKRDKYSLEGFVGAVKSLRMITESSRVSQMNVCM